MVPRETHSAIKLVFLNLDANELDKLIKSGVIETPDAEIDWLKTGQRFSCLMHACNFYHGSNSESDRAKCIALVEVLVKKHGASVNAQDMSGWTPVMFAAHFGYVRLLEHLIEDDCSSDLELHNVNGSTALMLASNKNHDGVVRYLMEKGANANTIQTQGNTSLHMAARNGYLEVARSLCHYGCPEKRARVDPCNSSHNTPLHIAAYAGHTEVVRFFLSEAADINLADKFGWTPLMFAVHQERIGCVEALLDCRPDVNACIFTTGTTVLHLAVQSGNKRVIQLLLNANADWSARDLRNRIPSDLVAARPNRAVVSAFVETFEEWERRNAVFRDTIYCGMNQETCLLHRLQPDSVVPSRIAYFFGAPSDTELIAIRRELERLGGIVLPLEPSQELPQQLPPDPPQDIPLNLPRHHQHLKYHTYCMYAVIAFFSLIAAVLLGSSTYGFLSLLDYLGVF